MNTNQQEKLINAIIYFTKNTWFCNRIKLYKLLYFFDFGKFEAIGSCATGLEYYAWRKGPVPSELESTINDILQKEIELQESYFLKNILEENFEFREDSSEHKTLIIKSKKAFDETVFTKREYRLLQELVTKYEKTKADEMILATHGEDSPWDKTWKNNPFNRIDYFLACPEHISKTEIQTKEIENEMIRSTYGVN
jgi:uncharacterized phage-associated protein